MIKKFFCTHNDSETNGTDYGTIAKNSNDAILERKKEYAKNLGDWIEAYVKDNLDSKAMKAAKKGMTTFELCTFEREKHNWYGKTLWLFTGLEMKGGSNAKFWYNHYKKEGRYYSMYYLGDFFDVNTYLVERGKKVGKNKSFRLEFGTIEHEDPLGFCNVTYSIIVTMK